MGLMHTEFVVVEKALKDLQEGRKAWRNGCKHEAAEYFEIAEDQLQTLVNSCLYIGDRR